MNKIYELIIKKIKEWNQYNINKQEIKWIPVTERYPEEFGFGRRHENAIAWAELPEPYTKNEHT